LRDSSATVLKSPTYGASMNVTVSGPNLPTDIAAYLEIIHHCQRPIDVEHVVRHLVTIDRATHTHMVVKHEEKHVNINANI